jgi:hypothetical protein
MGGGGEIEVFTRDTGMTVLHLGAREIQQTPQLARSVNSTTMRKMFGCSVGKIWHGIK